MLLEEVLGPDNAVNGFRRRVSDGASWEGFLGGFRLALVALSQSLRQRKGIKEGKSATQT